MPESEFESNSPVSVDDDDIVWPHTDPDDTDFILLRHPLPDAYSLPSSSASSDGHLSSPLSDQLTASSLPISTQPDSGPSVNQVRIHKKRTAKKKRLAQLSGGSSASSEYLSGISTPLASYDDASAFISRFLSSPVKEKSAELDLLRALIVELGIRSPNVSDIPHTLTSARKMIKTEVHINIKEYVDTRHEGQSALRRILKPSKSALRKGIRKGNRAPLKWVKQQGLQVLLVTCFT